METGVIISPFCTLSKHLYFLSFSRAIFAVHSLLAEQTVQPTIEDKISSTILASGKDGVHFRVSQFAVTQWDHFTILGLLLILLSDYDAQLCVDYKSVMVGAFERNAVWLWICHKPASSPMSFIRIFITHTIHKTKQEIQIGNALRRPCNPKRGQTKFMYGINPSFTSDCNDDINFESVPLFAPLSTQNSPYMCILPNKWINFERPWILP